jgi:hypothetical protein
MRFSLQACWHFFMGSRPKGPPGEKSCTEQVLGQDADCGELA